MGEPAPANLHTQSARGAPIKAAAATPTPLDRTLGPGDRIGEVWEIQEVLGKGGMGSVYRCFNVDAPRIVAAIKLLDPAFQFNAEAKERFLREAEILYTIEHPNVVRVSNVDLDARPPFLVMEFVDGLSLEDELGNYGPLPGDLAVDRARQLADALHRLHRRTIYHRDIKPQNLLIDAEGTMKIVDFGLAVHKSGGRKITHHTAVTNFGTVSYCPPEWGRGQLEPATWDLYSLGVVLYEMLTGTVAFPVAQNLDVSQQMLQVLSDKKRIAALDPGPQFSPELRAVVRRLTARDPDARFPDARSLCAALALVDPFWVQPDPEPIPTARPAPPKSADATPTPRTATPVPAMPSSRSLGMLGMIGLLVFAGLVVGVTGAVVVLVLVPLFVG